MARPAGASLLLCLAWLLLATAAWAQADPLPSWNDGAAKKAILAFVQAATDPASPDFVRPEARVAAFDQDGTTWVEQPMYTQGLYCLDRLRELAKAQPELAATEPFKTALTGGLDALRTLSSKDLSTIFAATPAGKSVEEYARDVDAWLHTARDSRFGRPYTDLVYQPMLEVMRYLRGHGFKTYFVTGGEQDFVRVFSERVYGIPPEQVVGTMDRVTYGSDASGRPTLLKTPALLLSNADEGKPEGIHLMIGRRPLAAFGNSTGDRQMLEYVKAGQGPRLAVLVHHDDAAREYAYGPDSPVGALSDALIAQAGEQGWLVISMRKDWKRVFPWEP